MQVTLPEITITPMPDLISLEQLKQILPNNDSVGSLLPYLNDTLHKYNINTPLRISHFLAQVMHESANLSATKENLNYSKEGLLKTFSRYFNNTTAGMYARQPEKIASKVYANRMGNGNEVSQDGWKYRGQGYLQLTGKDNYKALSKELGVDFVEHPELLQTPQYAFMSAGSYWNKTNLNKYADMNKIDSISDLINLGHLTAKTGDAIGYSDRVDKFNKIYKILKK